MNSGEFPHSEISGSKDVCSSPKLIAAYHVFHRLPVPRHSPCALCSLTVVLLSQNISYFRFSICQRDFTILLLFIAARRADDTDKVALLDGEGHVIQRLRRVGHTLVIDVAQVFNTNDFGHSCSFPAGYSPVAVPFRHTWEFFVRVASPKGEGFLYFSSLYNSSAQASGVMTFSGIGIPALTSSSRSSAACGTSR